MPSEVIGEFVDVSRPVAVLLESFYIVLLTFSFLASVITSLCLLWNRLGNGRPMPQSLLPMQADPDDEMYKDEELYEERADLEFENDTDEEYMRRPY